MSGLDMALQEEKNTVITLVARGDDRIGWEDRSLCWGEAQRAGYQSRERFGCGGAVRGRDRYNGRYGERIQNQVGGSQDRWKHDLFDEANRSPTPKNEEDEIAKVEALLAS
ncbi:hypothetical protein Taro_025313 [Colocasia esculenta]|uniref:Uncharacterized protein n=1 Tax=Colocasia esculenta TaxID=4460 RepID=A0A843V939_COLES|nr:hypothetical protein [Colocasia esculenta]